MEGPEAVAEPLVKDLDGQDTTLSEIAGDQPTLFIFVRHFG
jgi:hypothetical protein